MKILDHLKMLWLPAAYHGAGKKGNFFEGWFFKIVDESRRNIYAFIPGISMGENPHGFIQILDGQTHQSDYVRFPIKDFRASSKRLEIQIGDNLFTAPFMELNVESNTRSFRGKLSFRDLKPWPVKIFSPGVMGWYAFVPLMECFHSVLSFDHTIQGRLSINGTHIQFDNGKGYIEKDWGRSFPSAYIWIQSNHFEQSGISLMASVAKIPWLTGAFRGFIIGLSLDNKLYRFATYTGARLHYLTLNDTQVELAVSDRKFLLTIAAVRIDGGLLHAPYQMKMLQRVSETLRSRVTIALYRIIKNEKRLVFSGTGDPAGLDVNGKLKEIVDGSISK